MRNVFFISASYCNACNGYIERVLTPLLEKYPSNLEVHMNYDAKIAEVNARGKLMRVPTVVVEHNGEEEFRFTAFLEADELEEIILCEAETLTLEDILIQ